VDRRRTCAKWPPNLLGNGHRGKIKTVWPHPHADVRFRGLWGSGVWTRQRNQRLETGFASQKIALGSKWEADREVCACAYVPRRFPPPWSVEELDACFIQGGRVKTVR
jgi:hypothetical protein